MSNHDFLHVLQHKPSYPDVEYTKNPDAVGLEKLDEFEDGRFVIGEGDRFRFVIRGDMFSPLAGSIRVKFTYDVDGIILHMRRENGFAAFELNVVDGMLNFKYIDDDDVLREYLTGKQLNSISDIVVTWDGNSLYIYVDDEEVLELSDFKFPSDIYDCFVGHSVL